jgi:hypothetical protein
MILNLRFHYQRTCADGEHKYHKLVETFRNVSDCKTYIDWWFSLQFTRPDDLDC